MIEGDWHVQEDRLLFSGKYAGGLKKTLTTRPNETALHVAAAVLEIVFLREYLCYLFN